MEAANRYEILSKLAIGGMAEIFLARSTSSMGVQRYVVLKRIHAEHAHDQQFAQMFLDEARLASLLQHPNIAQVFDVGKLGESVFFTMEYVHGETLRTILQHVYENNLELSLAFVLTTIAGSAAGLHHAHERKGMDGRPLGIVHRDISPANIMVTYDGIVKIVDFGVAKATTARHQTVAGTVKGKISYMSPEQCRGNVVDRRSDLFSLGIVMWELITRGRLYRRQSDFDSMAAIVNEPPIPPSAYRPGIPAEIDRLVLRLLAKSPEQRFASGDELVDEIENIAGKLNLGLNVSSIKSALRTFFGNKPEPWLAPEATDHEPITIMSGDSPIDDKDLYSAIEVAAQPHLPQAPKLPAPQTIDPALFQTGIPTNVRGPAVGRKAEDLLKTLQMPPNRKAPPPPELDFDVATTRDLGGALAAAESDDDAFGEDGPTILDDHSPVPGPKTQPMMTVAQPGSARTAPSSNPPANVFVSSALQTEQMPAQRPPVSLSQQLPPHMPLPAPPVTALPITSSMAQTKPRPIPSMVPQRPTPNPSQPPQNLVAAAGSAPRNQMVSDATRPVQPLPAPPMPARGLAPEEASGQSPAIKQQNRVALFVAIFALLIVAAVIVTIVVRG